MARGSAAREGRRGPFCGHGWGTVVVVCGGGVGIAGKARAPLRHCGLVKQCPARGRCNCVSHVRHGEPMGRRMQSDGVGGCS